MLFFLDRKDNLKIIEDVIKFDKDNFVSNLIIDDRDNDIKIDLYFIYK